MNPRTTILLLLAALGLFAYVWFYERHTPGTLHLAEATQRLFPAFEPGQANVVDILRTNSIIRAERQSNGRWQLMNPSYPAQTAMIDNWLASLKSLTRQAFITAQDLQNQPGGLSAFGLDPPQATVSVETTAGRIQFRIGNQTQVGEKLYLQNVGSDGVVVKKQPLRLIPGSVVEVQL